MGFLGRDHGGDLDVAVARFGGSRADWIDLSTGINPVPYPLPEISAEAWTALPDRTAQDGLLAAARQFWRVPEEAGIVAAPGASALIAQIPRLAPFGRVRIPGPTYNEHAAAFAAGGWVQVDGAAEAQVIVHPNNPDGRLWSWDDANTALRVIDESFCDTVPEVSFVQHSSVPGTIILKSFGKFWGLAGMRLGFAIGAPDLCARLGAMLGPWAVPGPALEVGTAALRDEGWAQATRARLARDAVRMDAVMGAKGATLVGGTDLFRLYDVGDAQAMQARLAEARIWSRVFPYSAAWLRLGLPPAHGWDQLEAA
ncbi:MAG: threonine-phosphate decarboxylase [Pseudomonadota bacterium]